MVALLRMRRWRVILMSVTLALLATGTLVSPSLAATSPFVAGYNETTTPSATCPAQLDAPAGAFCFSGTGTGPTFPPGGQGTENFIGYVDLNHPIPGACPAFANTTGFPDFNIVTITTRSGVLNLTTNGTACGVGSPASSDSGRWTASGGTGIFAGATGSGSVNTIGRPNQNGTIASISAYTGTLNTR